MPSKTYDLVPEVPEVPDVPEPKAKAPIPLSAFTRLSKVVRLYEPDASIKPSPSSPTTILLCSWMNAAAKHIDYYSRSYMKLYPGARIIIVTIDTRQFLLTSEVTRRAQIKEAISAILALPQDDERLLVHALSNGGAKRLYGISAAYAAKTGKPLPLKAYVLDSAPGIPQFRRDIHALSMPIRNHPWFIRFPFKTAVFMVTCVVYVFVNCKLLLLSSILTEAFIFPTYAQTHQVFHLSESSLQY
jgi:hypothetical protein